MAVEKLSIHAFASQKEFTPIWLRNFLLQENYFNLNRLHIRLKYVSGCLYLNEKDMRDETVYREKHRLPPITERQVLFTKAHMEAIYKLQRYVIHIFDHYYDKCDMTKMLNEDFQEYLGNGYLSINIHQLYHGIVQYDSSIESDVLTDKPVTLQDFIKVKWIYLPAMQKDHRLKIHWTKRCMSCGDYFQDRGPKNTFCSGKCRARDRALQKKKERLENTSLEIADV